MDLILVISVTSSVKLGNNETWILFDKIGHELGIHGAKYISYALAFINVAFHLFWKTLNGYVLLC